MVPDQANSASGSTGPDPARRFAMRLKACLNGDRSSDAIRLFMDGVAHKLVPDQPNLARWLMKVVGRVETLRLTKAFALKECFYCRGGLERCDACDGRGYLRDQGVCECCVGLGVAACDFCAGSGWVTYNYMPAGFRLPVILERTKVEARKMDTLLSQATQVVTEPNSRETGKVLAKELAQLNRLMGVFENAIVAAERLAAQDYEVGPGVAELVSTCRHDARRLQSRTRQVLRKLADFTRAESARAAMDVSRTVAARRSEFYASLVTSEDFLGTGLHHPYLHERQEPSGPSDKPPPSAEPQSEAPG